MGSSGEVLRVGAVVEQCWHRVPGGTATATARSMEALQSREDLEIVGISALHAKEPSVPLSDDIPVCRAPLPRRALYDSWHYLRHPRPGLLGQVLKNLDIVHATGGVVPPAPRSALVVTIHDLIFQSNPEWFTSRGVHFAQKAFELAKAEADLIIVPSQATADACQEAGIEIDRIRIVPWGVDVKISEASISDVVAKYKLPSQFALWVGTAEPRKNLLRLIEAVAQTECQIPLVLVGPTGWGNTGINNSGINNSLDSPTYSENSAPIQLGYVPEDDLAALYAAAHVFIYPSLAEGFGLPVLEAMAHGTPVITSSNTATAEIVTDSDSLVNPTDTEALAEAIDLIVANTSEHRRRSELAIFRARELNWTATANGIAAAYHDAVL